MENRTLHFGNAHATLHMELTDGKLYTIALEDLDSGYRFENSAKHLPLFTVPSFDPAGADITITQFTDTRNGLSAEADVMHILFTKDGRQVRVELRTYRDNPFIQVSLALAGRFGLPAVTAENGEESGIETARRAAKPEMDVLFRCPMTERHLKVRTVVLRDITDGNNILVEESHTTVYTNRPHEGKGQLFFVDAYLSEEMLMVAKEAPCFAGRVADSAYDIRVEPMSGIVVAGIGANLSSEAEYTFETPLFAVSFAPGSRAQLERDFRAYYRLDMQATLNRGLIAMSNTWGDRNQDAAVCESFMLGEIEQAKRLGVTAVQIDDGWQKGISANSKLAKGTLWGSGYYDSDPDYWTPHPTKFPRGLAPVAKAAENAGLVLGLWFSPDLARSYENWERDAETLMGLHRQYGVKFFKLDGIKLEDKTTETRLSAMIDRVHKESGGAVTFNFDITAQRRWGYLYKREYGNLFVENRYSDFLSYYPHSTLRTVWMLSRYIPTAKLQMEFLNLRRNAEKYGDDPLAPNRYRMDWAYAAVMFACPLYWMEMTHLSEEDSAVLSEIAAVWKAIAPELVWADVTPVGQEPDGLSFTGLRASCGDHGYILLFRENGIEDSHRFMLPSLQGKTLTKLAGNGEASLHGAVVTFTTDEERSFGLFRYE